MNDDFEFGLWDIFEKAGHTIKEYYSDYVYTSGLEDFNDEEMRIIEYNNAI